jgi:hypothetical protein
MTVDPPVRQAHIRAMVAPSDKGLYWKRALGNLAAIQAKIVACLNP